MAIRDLLENIEKEVKLHELTGALKRHTAAVEVITMLYLPHAREQQAALVSTLGALVQEVEDLMRVILGPEKWEQARAELEARGYLMDLAEGTPKT